MVSNCVYLSSVNESTGHMLRAQIILDALLPAHGGGGREQSSLERLLFSVSDSARRDASLKALSAGRSLVWESELTQAGGPASPPLS